MKTSTVQKRLTYKRATYLQGTGNLQTDLEKAVGAAGIAKKVGQRTQLVNAEENTVLLFNSVRFKWSMAFGSMLIYTKGRNQPLVTEDDSAEELTVEQLAPPKDAAGARRDFVESLLFFGIKNNHVVILQSMGLRARQLESHLNWLLQDQTGIIPVDDRVGLADQPSKAALQTVLKNPVKRVSIGLPLESEAQAPNIQDKAGGKTRTSTKQIAFQPAGVGFDVLSSILGAKWLNKMKLKESLDESRLKVEVLVSYAREISGSGQDLLNDIAMNLRQFEPEEVTIDLKGGGTISGDELKIAGSISVDTFGGLVVPDEIYPRMREWLTSQIEAGVIDP